MRLASFSLAVVAASAAQQPCDIFGSTGTPCVAAHSLVRALYSIYSGPLYQVRRLTDNATFDVATLTAGGFANAKSQDAFCGSAPCVVQRIYDQSPFGNNLDVAPPGGAVPRPDKPVNATRHPITANGNPVYAAYFEGGMGYRIDITTGVAQGNAPETLYMVRMGSRVYPPPL
jgi:non-reducing end alpha-L-arabinofuranosidase